MSETRRTPSAATPGLTISLYPPPWRATEEVMEMRQPFGPPWRLLLVRDDCGSVVAMVPLHSTALLRRSTEEDYARALPDAQERAAFIASAPSLLARVARLEKFARAVAEWTFEGDVRELALAALAEEEGR